MKRIDDNKTKAKRFYDRHRERRLRTARKWRRKNKDKISEYNREYARTHQEEISEHRKAYPEWYKETRRAQKREWSKKYPWRNVMYSMRQRCNDKKAINYKNYGGRGIKIEIDLRELRELWIFSGADEMKKPELHRIDNDGNYSMNNCKFIEGEEHRRIHRVGKGRPQDGRNRR